MTRKYCEKYAEKSGVFFNADFFDCLYVECMQARMKMLWAFIIVFFALVNPISTFLNNHEFMIGKIWIALAMVLLGEFAWALFLSCNKYQKAVSKLITVRRNNKNTEKDGDLFWGKYSEDEIDVIHEMEQIALFGLMPNTNHLRYAESLNNEASQSNRIADGNKLQETEKEQSQHLQI